ESETNSSKLHRNTYSIPTHTKYPINRVTFAPETTLAKVNQVRFIGNLKVYWEKLESKKPTIQCYRCQAHGHSSINCNKKAMCVKCAGPYGSKKCTKPLEIPPMCTNCKGSHPANYSKCPAFLAFLAKRDAIPPISTSLSYFKKTSISRFILKDNRADAKALYEMHKQLRPSQSNYTDRKRAGSWLLNIKPLLWNTTSIQNKKQEVQKFLEDHLIDIVLITETWLTPGIRIPIQGSNIQKRQNT
ncbi:unnamed protein product, partial [Heterotrigona itama]